MASSSYRHPASLIPGLEHDQGLLRLLSRSVDRGMIRYIVKRVEETITVDDDDEIAKAVATAAASLPSPPVTPTKTGFNVDEGSPQATPSIPRPTIPSLEDFIILLVRRANVQASTLLCTLVYLDRLRNKLPKMAKGTLCHQYRLLCLT